MLVIDYVVRYDFVFFPQKYYKKSTPPIFYPQKVHIQKNRCDAIVDKVKAESSECSEYSEVRG